MKTLLFTLEYPPFKGGVANYYENIVKQWPEPGQISVLHNNENELINNLFWPKWLPAIFKLKKIINKHKIKHIIVGHILPLGTVTYYVAKITKIKYTVVIHGMDMSFAQRIKRKEKMARKILDKAENIICSSSYTAELVKNFLNNKDSSNKIKIINPGINTDIKIKEDILETIINKHRLFKKTVLFSVCRLVKRKGVDMTIKAMKETVKSTPNLYYFIAGDGPDKLYIKESAKGVKNIVYLGGISDEEKWAWLKACDIFIMPSRDIDGDFEGFGIVYLEASLMGKPIVAGDSGGVRDAVLGAKTGILVDPENENRIAGAITALAQDRALRIKLGEEGKRRVLKEFKWTDKVREIFNIINSN